MGSPDILALSLAPFCSAQSAVRAYPGKTSMNGFELQDLLKAVGPTASLIFARYSSAYEHYRKLIAALRQPREHDYRRSSLKEQIIESKLHTV